MKEHGELTQDGTRERMSCKGAIAKSTRYTLLVGLNNMLGYEILINEEAVCLAGHEKEKTLYASIFYAKGLHSPQLIVSAMVNTNEGSSDEVRWVERYVELGSKVRIKVVDVIKFDAPTRMASFGTRRHPHGEKELFCSFCGRSEHKVKRLMEGEAANICLECAETCHLTLQQPQGK